MSSNTCDDCGDMLLDCLCEWSQIYSEFLFGEFISENSEFETFKDYAYYQCYGGGPEGGYITNGRDVYSVERNWGSSWTVIPVNGRIEIAYKGYLARPYLRIVP